MWGNYELKVRKDEARKAYAAVAAERPVPFDDLMLALLRYIANKPRSHDWALLSTWLHGRRWLDEYPERPPPGRDPPRGGAHRNRVPFRPTSYAGRG